MLKPSQIREKEFAKTTMGGYKMSDVDGFLDEVVESYEQLYKENSELLKKLRILVDNIEEYRRKEQITGSTADETLSNANKEAERILSQARLEAEQIVADAKDKSAQIGVSQAALDEIKSLREKEEKILANIRTESEKFRKSLLSMYTEHLTLIQSMVDGKAPVKSAEEQPKCESYEKKLDVKNAEIDEKFVYDDIDAFFAKALAQESGHIKEAFGGFKFEMGGEQEELPARETVSDFEETDSYAGEHITVHNASGNDDEGANNASKPDDIKSGFKISFPDEDDQSDDDDENLDDLFAGFFNNNNKPE